MNISQHITRAENIKVIQSLHAAGIDHKVISAFMKSEGVELETLDINIILNSFNALGEKKISSKKMQALIQAKLTVEEDESFPCPASY
jgi:hypothetical protein